MSATPDRQPWPQVVLFDFDGTLGDSYPAIAASVNHVRGLQGLEPLPVEEVRLHVGKGPKNLLSQTVGRGDPTENVAHYLAHHPTVLREGTQLMPGAEELLRKLQSKQIQLGLCSNKNLAFSQAILQNLGIAERFAVVMGPEKVERIKPAPDMLLAALRELQLTPESALYVGDMVVDIEAGRAAGIPVWVVATGSESLATLNAGCPDRLFLHLSDLGQALLNP